MNHLMLHKGELGFRGHTDNHSDPAESDKKSQLAEKELLYCWVSNGFCVLVPKKRGEGFVKQPYGHHHIRGLSDLEVISACDLIGLDGYLHFDGTASRSAYTMWENRAAFESLVLPGLVKHYGFGVRKIEQDEFWRLLPN